MALTCQLYRDAKPPPVQQNKGKLLKESQKQCLSGMLQGIKYAR